MQSDGLTGACTCRCGVLNDWFHNCRYSPVTKPPNRLSRAMVGLKVDLEPSYKYSGLPRRLFLEASFGFPEASQHDGGIRPRDPFWAPLCAFFLRNPFTWRSRALLTGLNSIVTDSTSSTYKPVLSDST